MTPEYRPFSQKDPVEVSYLLPDGLNCSWTYVSGDTSWNNLCDITDQKVTQVNSLGQEARISIDSKDTVDRLGQYLKERYPQMSFSWGKNKFFESCLPLPSHLGTNPALDWESYKNEYQVVQFDRHIKRDVVIAKTFMLMSFGVKKEDGRFVKDEPKLKKIDRIIDTALRVPENHFYFVKEKDGERYLGSFITRYIPQLQEVQLHSVAGMALPDPRIVSVKNKLPILVAGFLDVVKMQYPTSVPLGISKNQVMEYGGIKKITFSSSGAAHLYEALGFEESQRTGLVIGANS